MYQVPAPIYPTSSSSYPEPSSSSVNSTLRHDIPPSSVAPLTETPSPSVESLHDFNFSPRFSSTTSTAATTPPSAGSPGCYELPCEQAPPPAIASTSRTTTVAHADNQSAASSSVSGRKRKAPLTSKNAAAPPKAPKMKKTCNDKASTSEADDQCPKCEERMQTSSIGRHCRSSCPMVPVRQLFRCECGNEFSRADALVRHRRNKGHQAPAPNPNNPAPSSSASSSVSFSAGGPSVPRVAPSAPFSFRHAASSSTRAIPDLQQQAAVHRPPAVPWTMSVSLFDPSVANQFPMNLPQGQSVPVRVLTGHRLFRAWYDSVKSGKKLSGAHVQDQSGNQYVVQPVDPYMLLSQPMSNQFCHQGGDNLLPQAQAAQTGFNQVAGPSNAGPSYFPSALPQLQLGEQAYREYASVVQRPDLAMGPAQEVVDWCQDQTGRQVIGGQAVCELPNPSSTEEPSGYVDAHPQSSLDIDYSGESGEHIGTQAAQEAYFDFTYPPWVEEKGAYAEAQAKVDSMLDSKSKFVDPHVISLNASVDSPSFAAWADAGHQDEVGAQEEFQLDPSNLPTWVDPRLTQVSSASSSSLPSSSGFNYFPGSFPTLPEGTIYE